MWSDTPTCGHRCLDGSCAAILLGDNPEALVHQLEDQFPKATLMGGDREFETLMARVIGMVEQSRATELCVAADRSPAIAGALSASARSSRGRPLAIVETGKHGASHRALIGGVFLSRCHAAGQTGPTPLMSRVTTNACTKISMGSTSFPCRWRSFCRSRAGFRRRRVCADRAASPHAVTCHPYRCRRRPSKSQAPRFALRSSS